MLRISVVIPCYNGEAFLDEALGSVAAQTRAADEVIVVDDGSTDGSVDIAARWDAVVVRQSNLGDGAARNAGVRKASGNVIAFLDADDRWLPQHLSVVTGLLDRAPTAVGAFGAAQRFGSRSELILGCVPPGPPAMVLDAAFRNWLHIPTASIVRREEYLAVGGCDEGDRSSVDFDLWLRLAALHPFVATHEVTVEWRMHPAQQSSTPWRQTAAVYRFRRRFVDRLVSQGDLRGPAFERQMTRAWLRDVRDRGRERSLQDLATLTRVIPVVQPWTVTRRKRQPPVL